MAGSLELQASGAIEGLVVTALDTSLPLSIDRPGLGRGPLEWPASLDPVARELHWLAFPEPTVTTGETSAIAGFQWKPTQAGISPSQP